MNLRNLGIVYRKELGDLLRDRRMIIAMIVVPVVVLPLLMGGLGIVAVQVVNKVVQEVPPVMVLGGEDSPKTLATLQALDDFKFVPPDSDYAKLISEKTIRAAVEIPPGFDAALQNGQPATIQIYDYEGEMISEGAASHLKDFFQDLRRTTVAERLAAHNLPKELVTPFEIEQKNVAPPEKVSGNFVGVLLPYIIIIMCAAGAIYPAIDLTAGEKERGTMETLLCSPVERIYLVLGKCLTVLTISLVSMLLVLSSTAGSVAMLKTLTAQIGGNDAMPLTLNLHSLVMVFLLMLPMALFQSAFMLAAGLFSRSVKEANSYLGPLMMFMMLPAMMGLLPGIELNYFLALIPVVNVSLVSKEILSGTYHWDLIALVFTLNCAYAAVALAAAVAMFKRESVIFRT